MRRALSTASGSIATAAQLLGITVRQMRHGVKRYGLAAQDWRVHNGSNLSTRDVEHQTWNGLKATRAS